MKLCSTLLTIYCLVAPSFAEWLSTGDQSPARQPPPPPSSPSGTPCKPEPGWWRPGNTYNDPRQNITATAIECCNICRSQERCKTWSRHRQSGACALKDKNTKAYLHNGYDSGFIGGTIAASVTRLRRCFTNVGVAYPRGSVMFRLRLGSASACCNACSNSFQCVSWHYNTRNKMCVANSNAPGSVRRGNHVVGAIMV